MEKRIIVVESGALTSLHPVTCAMRIGELPVANTPLAEAIEMRISQFLGKKGMTISVIERLWPSLELAEKLAESTAPSVFLSSAGIPAAWASKDGRIDEFAEKSPIDGKSILITYPWDLIEVNAELVGALDKDKIKGEIRKGVNIDGHVVVGKGSVLLPGTYVEGNAVIGKDCKIGPNCYIRGNTSIGDGCHVGNAVEIKNSILMENVSVGHLSYVGDSVICRNTNLGAGTITANLRHDGKNQKSFVDGQLIDTGRRKLGAIVGEDVHTGIHTSIYPGRKIWPGLSTRPGESVSKDIM